MAKLTYKHNYANTGKLMRSDEMAEFLKGIAIGVQQRAGEGYAIDTYQAGQRVIASVYTATAETYQKNMDKNNNVLLRALK